MEINNTDSKNLIITTDYGSKIEIKNNQTLIFNENGELKEISLKKIREIGSNHSQATADFKTDINSDNINSIIDDNIKTLKTFKIIILILLIGEIFEFLTWANIAKSKLFFIEFTLMTFFIILYGWWSYKLSAIKKVDISLNNHIMVIMVDFIDNNNKKETKYFEIGYASMNEISKIKEIIFSEKEKCLVS